MGKLETFTRTSVCDKHGEYTEQGLKPFNSMLWSGCLKCGDELKAEADAIKAMEQKFKENQEQQVFFKSGGIMRRYQGLTLNNFSPMESQGAAFKIAMVFVKEFDRMERESKTIIFNGGVGTGKTRLVQSMLQSLGFGEYVRAVDISRRVRATYSSNESEISEVQKFVDCKCLVIDEVGIQGGTEKEENLITDIVDRRYGDMRPTIICSNLDNNQLEAAFGQRAWSRLQQNCIICPIKGQDQRKSTN
tara:strand:+ start:526 stop:1266 length:741 start_codon:yes stop_codon:yes gene_type:complete